MPSHRLRRGAEVAPQFCHGRESLAAELPPEPFQLAGQAATLAMPLHPPGRSGLAVPARVSDPVVFPGGFAIAALVEQCFRRAHGLGSGRGLSRTTLPPCGRLGSPFAVPSAFQTRSKSRASSRIRRERPAENFSSPAEVRSSRSRQVSFSTQSRSFQSGSKAAATRRLASGTCRNPGWQRMIKIPVLVSQAKLRGKSRT